jgi:hypothetical protein
MVSEDSQDLERFAVIHRLCDLRDLHGAGHREMPAEIHRRDDRGELLEVVPLRCSQRVLSEERDDHVPKIREPLHAIPVHVLPVIVVPAVPEDPAASEEANEVLEHIPAAGSLCHCELRPNLPAEPHRGTSIDRAAETTFAIDGTNYPSDGREPFLLVFRTSHVVTAVHEPTLASTFDTASSGGSTGFSSIWPAAHRIVTDAGGSSPGLPGGFLP